MQVLCVDQDKNFCNFIKKEGEALGVSVSGVTTFDQAQEKMRDQSSYACIFNSSYCEQLVMLDQLSFSLAYVDLPNVSFLQELKATQKVRYIVGKMMSSEEARYLLGQLCQLEAYEKLKGDWVAEIPEQLMKAYESSSYEKLGILEKLIKNNSHQLPWEEFQFIVHKIAGSAGFYGRFKACEICKKMETHIKKKEYNLIDLNSFYRQLYLYIQ
ncbi:MULTISPECIES: hypothetical protein [unclassified Neochlamydia]|uniref:Hpt domain-containing protein n=1 Tax=unclassified Neochlamydia TaxID=2643326 RepID=UPI00140D431C|nr:MULTISPECIES: hypothetical protein [unclassified Neochlamydia]NGY94804.1 hypothetical protein [Neochlamydia sp. AcF84]